MQHFHSIIFQDTEATPKGHPLALESGSAPPLSTPLGASHIPPSKNPNFSWWPIRLHTTSLVFSLFFPLPFFYPPRCATPHRPPLCSSNTPGLAVPQGLCTGCSSLKKASSLRYTHQFSLVQSLSHVRLFAIPWTAVPQAPLSMEFSRQEYWSGLPYPTPRDLPDPGIKPTCPASPALADRFSTTKPTIP